MVIVYFHQESLCSYKQDMIFFPFPYHSNSFDCDISFFFPFPYHNNSLPFLSLRLLRLFSSTARFFLFPFQWQTRKSATARREKSVSCHPSLSVVTIEISHGRLNNRKERWRWCFKMTQYLYPDQEQEVHFQNLAP